MKRLVLNLLWIYALLTVVVVLTIRYVVEKQQEERDQPRKSLYVVNHTDDTLSVHFAGVYTKAEKRAMQDKPDRDDVRSNPVVTPSQWEKNVEQRAAHFPLPLKSGMDIDFPKDFIFYIESPKHKLALNREQFYALLGNNLHKDWWIIDITPEWLEENKDFYVHLQ